MQKKVAVVTGSNKGIGFAIVKALCLHFPGDVYLTARDKERGKAAIKALEAEGLNPKYFEVDITNRDSIKRLAVFLKEKYGGLDVLVNNAAIGYLPGNPTPFPEQAVNTINVNFFGTLNVCRELFPLLRPHARVVNLSSSTGKLSLLTKESLRQRFLAASTEEDLCQLMNEFVYDAKLGVHEQNGWGPCSYQVSKMAINALTFIQHRRFSQDPDLDIVVNAVHPGRCDTDLVNHTGTLTPDEGAVVPVYCALLPPGVESPRGEYLWCDKTICSWL